MSHICPTTNATAPHLLRVTPSGVEGSSHQLTIKQKMLQKNLNKSKFCATI